VKKSRKKSRQKNKPSFSFDPSNCKITMPGETKYHWIEDWKFQEFMKIKKPACLVITGCCLTYVLDNFSQIDLINSYRRGIGINLTPSQGIELMLFIFAIIGVVVSGVFSCAAWFNNRKIINEITLRPAITMDMATIAKMCSSQKIK
jgi:hypothetical protein